MRTGHEITGEDAARRPVQIDLLHVGEGGHVAGHDAQRLGDGEQAAQAGAVQVPDRPPDFSRSRTSVMTMPRSTAFTMS